jgi:hypothetical protein
LLHQQQQVLSWQILLLRYLLILMVLQAAAAEL